MSFFPCLWVSRRRMEEHFVEHSAPSIIVIVIKDTIVAKKRPGGKDCPDSADRFPGVADEEGDVGQLVREGTCKSDNNGRSRPTRK